MKSIFIDCCLGISGDMLASALFDLGVPENIFLENLVKLKIDQNYKLNFMNGDSEGIKGIVCTKTKNQIEELSVSLNNIKKFLLDSGMNFPRCGFNASLKYGFTVIIFCFSKRD